VPDLALPLQIGQDPNLVLERYLWVDAVELKQLNAFELESTQAHLHLLA
jgi:hypothetical protein